MRRLACIIIIEDEAPAPIVFDEHDLAIIGMYEDQEDNENG